MSLNPGTRLGPYEILAPIGAGGMGEVYRAKDTKLNRDVAIKVLPESFALDADRVARFTREAQVLASLNHPNIAAIYGIEENAIVMELVDGEDLSAVIARHGHPEAESVNSRLRETGRGGGAPRKPNNVGLSLDEALPIARQIADALEAAHEQGIVHRDLKPANIKVRGDGTVKVLDFGLAKAMDPTGASSAVSNVANSPTMMSPAMTSMGMILGTAAYMSPEQAKGRAVDKRADIWAFGVVLYEMLTGRRAFDGEDISTTLAAVLMREPEWVALPADTPPGLVALIRRCLERDPKLRLRDIGEARLLLSNPQTMSGSPAAVSSDSVAAKRRIDARAVAAALALAGLAALAAWWFKPAPPVINQVARFRYPLPDGQQFTRTGRHLVAISPDGSKIVYVANEQLYLREVGQLDAQPIRGTQEDPLEPVFSPDSQSIAYFAAKDSGNNRAILKRIAISGGTPQTVCETESFPAGVSWRNGLIAFGQQGRIDAVADSGGTPRKLVTVDAPSRAVQPQLLDDGEHVLFTVIDTNATSDEGQVVIQRLDGTARTLVMTGGSNAQVLPTGHLVYIHDGTVFAVRFDAKRRAVTGAAVPIVEGVSEVSGTWAGHFSVSLDGSLVYRPGIFSGREKSPVWVDRKGSEQAIAVPFRDHAMPRLSPDGKKLVVSSSEGENDIWVWDIAKETFTRLTFGPAVDAFAMWMPDNRRVIFKSTEDGRTDIFRRMADGTGSLEPLTKNGTGGEPESVSPDGKFLVYRTGDPTGTGADLRVLPLDGTGQSRALLADARYTEFGGDISPDGQWIAYQSKESGKNSIYVRPFPNVDGGKWMVSAEGGTQPRWSRSGRELFYVIWPRLFSVPIGTGAAFAFGKPQTVVENLQYSFGPYTFGHTTAYDVGADGRFLFMKNPGAGASTDRSLIVVTHWFDELKARMSGK